MPLRLLMPDAAMPRHFFMPYAFIIDFRYAAMLLRHFSLIVTTPLPIYAMLSPLMRYTKIYFSATLYFDAVRRFDMPLILPRCHMPRPFIAACRFHFFIIAADGLAALISPCHYAIITFMPSLIRLNIVTLPRFCRCRLLSVVIIDVYLLALIIRRLYHLRQYAAYATTPPIRF